MKTMRILLASCKPQPAPCITRIQAHNGAQEYAPSNDKIIINTIDIIVPYERISRPIHIFNSQYNTSSIDP